jgi:DNA anti-recombination protein RmuC
MLTSEDLKKKNSAFRDLIMVRQNAEHELRVQAEHARRLETLESQVHQHASEQRRLSNQVKRTSWEVAKLALRQRKDVEDQSHRITDTKERLDKIQKIVDWTLYTILGLLLTTALGAVIKYTFQL